MADVFGKEALKRCIEVLGNQAAVGEVVGRRQTSISECLRKGQDIPAEWCIPLDRATAQAGNRVSCHQLRPDLWPETFAPEKPVRARRAAA
ncbi:MAG: YdaS family helix-turn-helix protein [Rhizomicrobium sp.]